MSNSDSGKERLLNCLLGFARGAFPDLARREMRGPQIAECSPAFEAEMAKIRNYIPPGELEIHDCKVLRNGHTMKWILGDHKEGEEICLMCDQCGWISLPILIFKEYFHFSSFRTNLPEDERALMSARMHLTEVMGGKVHSYCPHCQKHLAAMLDLRKEERQPEQGQA